MNLFILQKLGIFIWLKFIKLGTEILFISQTEMDPYFEGKTCQTYSADYSYADCDADYVRHKIDAVCGRSFKPLWMFSSFNDSSYSGDNL